MAWYCHFLPYLLALPSTPSLSALNSLEHPGSVVTPHCSSSPCFCVGFCHLALCLTTSSYLSGFNVNVSSWRCLSCSLNLRSVPLIPIMFCQTTLFSFMEALHRFTWYIYWLTICSLSAFSVWCPLSITVLCTKDVFNTHFWNKWVFLESLPGLEKQLSVLGLRWSW